MGGGHLCTSDGASAAVRGKDDNGSDGRLEGAMQVREALNIEHVYLVNE